MSLLDIGNNVRNFLRKKALDAGFKPLKDNSLGANLRGIGQAGQISTNFAQQKVNNFAQPAYNIPVAGGVLKGIVNQPFNYAQYGAELLQNPTYQNAAKFVGSGVQLAAGTALPGLKLAKGPIKLQLPSLAKQSILKMGVPQGIGAGIESYGQGNKPLDIAKTVGLNTALGAGAGFALPLAGRGVQNAVKNIQLAAKPKPAFAYHEITKPTSKSKAKIGIKQDDQELMADLIDYVRSGASKKKQDLDLEFEASRLAEKILRGGKQPKSVSGMAAEFDKILKNYKAFKNTKSKFFPNEGDWVGKDVGLPDNSLKATLNDAPVEVMPKLRARSGNGLIKINKPQQSFLSIKKPAANQLLSTQKPQLQPQQGVNPSQNIVAQLSTPDKPLLLSGRYVAKTPAEAKRLFKKTGVAPELEFSQRGIAKPVKTQGYTPFYNAEATPKTLGKIKIKDQKAKAKQAEIEFKEWQKQMFAREGATRTTTGAVRDASKLIGGNTRSMAAKDIAGLKDISSPATQFVDVFRNFKKVYGGKYEEVKKVVLDPLFVKGKTGMLNDQEMWIKKIDDFEKGFGIKKGSSQSADVQKFGEKLISEANLVSKYGKEGADNIIRADKWFRQGYDQLLDEVNTVRAKIYPNNPDKIIPKRKDYYRHFNELSQGIDGLLNTLGRAIDVSPQLAGISYKTQPKSKWLSFAQKRVGAKTEYDAVGGFIDYVKAQTYAKHIDPHIDTFRQLGRELGEAGVEEGKGLNNFGLFLEQFADNLSGKTNPADRFVQQLGGRKPIAVLNWLNQRVKANVILGNASSSIAQIFNLPNGIAEAGPKFATKGFGRAIASMFQDNKPQNQSVFLKERYFRGFEKFDRGMIDNGRKFAAWMITALDEVGTKSMWNMMYEKGSAQGLKGQALVNYADDVTRKMVAGRGIGEMPLIQQSKAFQLVAPFQVEVTNAWYVIGDMIGEKAFGKLMTLALTTYVMNRAAEQIRGSDVSFDPIQATIDATQAFNEEDDKKIGAMRFAGRLGGEVISNIPFGQSAAAVYPEYGFKVGGTQYPTREQFFGKGDPTRFGSGLLATKGLQDPLFKVIPPFGGQQIKRTIDGINTTLKGYSQTPSGDVRFPVESNPVRNIQRGIFGEYSTPEAREYFDENRSKLGSNQSEVFKNLSGKDRENYYQGVLSKREKDKGVDELKAKELEQSDIQNEPVINETLDRLVKSEYYQKLDEEGKFKAIDKAVANIRKQVKGSINLENGVVGEINPKIPKVSTPTTGQYEILNPETNKIKTIDIETPIEKPVLTGNTALDKKLISKFNSKLTSRANDIVALYEDGQIDGKTAESELTKLTTLKSSTGKGKKGKKPKKITIKKIAGARKITNIKIGKSSSLKPIKIKKLKLKSAKKVKKVGNIKIANYKLPKIKIS
jgi:hypothetical protein